MPWLHGLTREQQQLIRGLWIITGLLALGDVVTSLAWVGALGALRPLFDLKGEGNIPTWFSSLLLAGAALAAYRCAGATTPRASRVPWLAVFGLLLLLSCDEVVQLHEQTTRFMVQHVFTWLQAPQRKELGMVLVIGVPLTAVLLVLGRSLRVPLRDSASARRRLVLGAVLLFGSAVGLELVEYPIKAYGLEQVSRFDNLLEEILEMLGSITILSGLMVHDGVLRGGTRGDG